MNTDTIDQKYTSSEKHMHPPQNDDNRHIYYTRHSYWCAALPSPGDNIVTADGALGRLRDNLGVCHDCLRAIGAFLDGHTIRAATRPDMLDNLARSSLMKMAESIAVPYRDLANELVKPLGDIDWSTLSRECARMEVAIRDFRDIAHLCQIVYGEDQSPAVTN